MKKIFRTFIAIAAVTLLFSGCNDDDPEGLAVKYIFAETPAGGGTAEFTIYPGVNLPWEIIAGEDVEGFEEIDWIELSATEGKGKTVITATMRPNTYNWPRSGKIIVTSGFWSIPVNIEQAGAPLVFSVTPAAIALNQSTGVPDITGTITSNSSWYAEIVDKSDAGWDLRFDNNSTWLYGDGNGSIGLMSPANHTIYPRTARIKVTAYDAINDENISRYIDVTQQGAIPV